MADEQDHVTGQRYLQIGIDNASSSQATLSAPTTLTPLLASQEMQRHWPRLLQRSFVISAVRLRQTKTKMLLCHLLRPHNQLGSI